MTDLTQMSLIEAAAAVRSKTVTASDLLEACLTRIEQTEASVGGVRVGAGGSGPC